MTITGKRVRTWLAVGAAAGAAAAGAAGSASPAGASTSGPTESFVITGSAGEAHFVAHGAFTGGGVDTERNNSDVFHFGDGRLVVKHPNSASTFSFHLNPTTCFATVKGTGTYTFANGTGAYAHVTGSGTYVFTGQDVLYRNSDGSCDFTSQPKSSVLYVKGHGPVSLAPAG